MSPTRREPTNTRSPSSSGRRARACDEVKGLDRRRALVAGIALACAWRAASGAVKANARVGYLEFVRASDGERLYREFVEGLAGRGYVEGRNLRLIRRSADARSERLRSL